jgi:hypothetical protein
MPKEDTFTIGHPDAVLGFRTNPVAVKRPFCAPSHPEMPSFSPRDVHNVRRAMDGRDFTAKEAEAAVWGLALFSKKEAGALRAEFIRRGVL